MLLSPNTTWRSSDQTGSHYWSGQDVRVYIQGVYLEELIGIQFNLEENANLVFPYSSYKATGVMVGTYMIQGSLSINYKEPGYILDLIKTEVSTTPSGYILKNENNVEYAPTLGDLKVGNRKESLKKSLWGESSTTSTTSNTPYFGKGSTYQKGVTIIATFGEHVGNQLDSDVEGNGKLVSRISALRQETLTGVYFTRRSTGYDDSGKPIIETYDFIATDLLKQ